jgi:hypothetical protein
MLTIWSSSLRWCSKMPGWFNEEVALVQQAFPCQVISFPPPPQVFGDPIFGA